MKLYALPMLAAVLVSAAAPSMALPFLSKPKPKVTAPPAIVVPKPGPQDWVKIDPEDVLVIDTSKGRIFVELTPEIAPQSVARVKQLTREHFYDGLKFHRVIDTFMAQTGDPLGTGAGGSSYPNVKGEFTFRRDQTLVFNQVAKSDGGVVGFVGATPIETQPDAMMEMTNDHKVWAWGRFCSGVVGMARAGDADSANSQFFLMRQTNVNLDKLYTPWGRVVAGLPVVRTLKIGEPPVDPDIMTKVQILADIPEGQRPQVIRLSTKSPVFEAMVAKAREEKGSDFSVCDVDIPSQVQ